MSQADDILARIRELTGPDHELGFHPEQVDELIDLVRDLDRTLSDHREPLPEAWAKWSMTTVVGGKPTAVIMQRGAQ